MNRRNEVLRAISEAASVLDKSRHPNESRTSFDIVGAILDRGVPLVFRPLDKLWGAFVSDGEQRGIMVTSKLELSVQRFTLAHELGHMLLEHKFSLDDTVGFAGRHGPAPKTSQEAGADTFAAELLAPRSLIFQSAQRHGWTTAELQRPQTIYQLSLRLGISYQAACWALVTAKVLDRGRAERLQQATVQTIKREQIPTGTLQDSWAHVWALDKADSGMLMEAGPNDIFAVQSEDYASAGYIWRLVDVEGEARIVGQEDPTFDDSYGGPSSRTTYVQFTAPGLHHLVFEHVRPWSKSHLERMAFQIDTYGKERTGWSRRERQQALRMPL